MRHYCVDYLKPLRLGRRDVFACRLGMNICLHRADDNLACLFVFTHEPLVLFMGDHLARLERDWPQGQPAKPERDLTGSLVIFNCRQG